MVFKIGPLAFLIEKPGILTSKKVYVCVDIHGYLYLNTNPFKLAWEIITEWRKDKHLVG